jgi:hypothetical protein
VTKTYKRPSKLPGVGLKEAKRRLAKFVDDVAAGKCGVKTDPDEIVTLSKLIDEWIAHGGSRGRSPNTLHGYRSKLGRIRSGPLADVEVRRLTTRTSTAGTTRSWPKACPPPP